MKTYAVDSETALIEAGVLAPKMACITWTDESFEPGLLHRNQAEEKLHYFFSECEVIGANVAYDLAVWCENYPRLMPVIFRALRESRVLDVQINQRLIDLAYGRLDGFRDQYDVYHKFSYSLAALHERHGFGALDKSGDTYRLRYGELLDTPLEQWPEAAATYAKDDAVATLRVHRAQLNYAEFLKDGPAQARAAFALQLMSVRGMITDARACDEYIAETAAEIERCRLLLLSEKLVRENGSRDTKLAKARMVQVCAELEIEPKKTEGGAKGPGISLDAEACRDSGDPVLKAYATYTSAKTLLEKTQLLKLGSTGTPLQTGFVTLLNNGRISSREPGKPLIGTNFQNIPRKGKMRQCFVPRPGFVLCSVDYSMAELHTFAQCEIWITGKSKLAEALNAKKDVHCVLAALMLGCSYEEVLANKKVGKYKRARQLAKEGNFGGLGGMGWKRFMLQVNKKAESKDERIDETTSKWILESWRAAWEPEGYFEFCKSCLSNEGRGLGTVKQFISERVRGHIDYTAVANGFFSGLAADAMKSALLPLSEECYVDEKSPLFGSRPVLSIHDENLAELLVEKRHEAAFRMRDIMVNEFNKYTPDVPVRAEPAIAWAWYKDMETKFDENGQLRCWTLEDAA